MLLSHNKGGSIVTHEPFLLNAAQDIVDQTEGPPYTMSLDNDDAQSVVCETPFS